METRMATDPAVAGDAPPAAASPRFDAAAMRRTACGIATAAGVADRIELCFGQRAGREAAAGSAGATLVHRLRLDRPAAIHLEEVLTRVLGLPAAPGGAAARRPQA